MTPYNLTIERRGCPAGQLGKYSTVIWGKDRDDVIAYAKRAYRRVFVRVVSAKAVKPEKADTAE